MPNFTLRIQLVGNPSQEVYESLHARMKQGGFLQTVTGTSQQGQPKTVSLPHATYYGQTTADCVAVRDWAASHAAEVWGKNITFVAQTETWAIS
jgi:hypothetical protein